MFDQGYNKYGHSESDYNYGVHIGKDGYYTATESIIDGISTVIDESSYYSKWLSARIGSFRPSFKGGSNLPLKAWNFLAYCGCIAWVFSGMCSRWEILQECHYDAVHALRLNVIRVEAVYFFVHLVLMKK